MPTAMEMNEALNGPPDDAEPAPARAAPKPERKPVRTGECGACGRTVALVESGGKTVIELHAPRIAGKWDWRQCVNSNREVK